MSKKIILIIIIFFFVNQSYSQEKSKCYFDIQISNKTNNISDYSLRNVVVNSIEQYMPNSIERSLDANESCRILVWIKIITVKNRNKDEIGIAYSIYGAMRTYPTMITSSLPEDFTMGITGDKTDLEFLKGSIDELVSGIFGEFDEMLEIMSQYLKESKKQEN